MNEKITFIADLASTYNDYSEDATKLFSALNQIPENTLRGIYEEFGASDRFQPVNLLRAEVARLLLEGTEIGKELIEDIKERIRAKDLDYFSHLPAEFLVQLENYTMGSRDIFANWQRDWTVFHSFLYRGKVRETVQVDLEKIGKQLMLDLQLTDYRLHWVDFFGSYNFGTDYCWLALFPQNKFSHQDAFQFFLQIGTQIEAGTVPGSNVENGTRHTEIVETYEQIIEIFDRQKTDIMSANKELRGYYKYDSTASATDDDLKRFHEDNIVAANYPDFPLGDVSRFNSLEELNEEMGFPGENKSFEGSRNLWWMRSVNEGDVIFAAKGRNRCLGICIATSGYYFDEDAPNFKHRFKVNGLLSRFTITNLES